MRFVCVTWIDAECLASWQDTDALDRYVLPTVRHVGWVVRDTDKLMILAQGLSSDGHPASKPQFCNVIAIPRAMIKRVSRMAAPKC